MTPSRLRATAFLRPDARDIAFERGGGTEVEREGRGRERGSERESEKERDAKEGGREGE